MHILQTTAEESFLSGNGRLEEYLHRVIKLNDAGIFFCRKGRAYLSIDLKEYEIEKNTQICLFPGSILCLNELSNDFSISYFLFSKTLLQEVVFRLEPPFLHFLKENPCFTLPCDCTDAINGLMDATKAIYNDKEHSFRTIIAKNHLQSFLLDVYDKTHRSFTRQQRESNNRKDELFQRFITLIHQYSSSQREVGFYAGELCITSRYLSAIVRTVSGKTAKSLIDKHVILEIKVLLQSTSLSTKEIANRLQFPDQSFFGRFFKKHTGLSPTQYRQSLSK